MVSALVPGASGPGSSPGRGHCVVGKRNKLRRNDLRWTSILSRGSRNTPSRFMLQKPGIGSGSFGPVGSKGFILYKRSILKIQRPHYSGVIRNVAIDFTLKRHQMFPVHHTPEEIENAAIACHFGIVFEENSILENPTIIADVVILRQVSFAKRFPLTRKRKTGVLKNPAGLMIFFVFLTDQCGQ